MADYREVDRYRAMVREAAVAYPHAALLGLRTFEPAGLHERVRAGLSYAAFERLRRVLDVPASRLAEVLGIPDRTLARRKDAGRLASDESDRLVRLSRIVGLAVQLFEGDVDGVRSWLRSPHASLAGSSPLEFAATEVGAREVERLIGRLEHGVPA